VVYIFSEGQACWLYVELEAAIIGPARFAGLEFEPGLVNLILQEVAAQRDSLPLLEYALKEMWRNQQNHVFDYALYEAVGKVEGAISQHADTVLHTLPEDEQGGSFRRLSQSDRSILQLAGRSRPIAIDTYTTQQSNSQRTKRGASVDIQA
jgi:hypothetical protein